MPSPHYPGYVPPRVPWVHRTQGTLPSTTRLATMLHPASPRATLGLMSWIPGTRGMPGHAEGRGMLGDTERA